jgi:hypothetical protein
LACSWRRTSDRGSLAYSVQARPATHLASSATAGDMTRHGMARRWGLVVGLGGGSGFFVVAVHRVCVRRIDRQGLDLRASQPLAPDGERERESGPAPPLPATESPATTGPLESPERHPCWASPPSTRSDKTREPQRERRGIKGARVGAANAINRTASNPEWKRILIRMSREPNALP